jgi:hypothetical protein
VVASVHTGWDMGKSQPLATHESYYVHATAAVYVCNKLPCDQNPSSSSMFLPPVARPPDRTERCLSHWCWLLKAHRAVCKWMLPALPLIEPPFARQPNQRLWRLVSCQLVQKLCRGSSADDDGAAAGPDEPLLRITTAEGGGFLCRTGP